MCVKPLLSFYLQGSLKKEFPVNIGGSDVCFFCQKRVYVMERLSAEGKFFHRTCFKCDYCGTTLRLSSYAFDVEDGKATVCCSSRAILPLLCTPQVLPNEGEPMNVSEHKNTNTLT